MNPHEAIAFSPALSLGSRLIWQVEGINIYALRRSGDAGTDFLLFYAPFSLTNSVINSEVICLCSNNSYALCGLAFGQKCSEIELLKANLSDRISESPILE